MKAFLLLVVASLSSATFASDDPPEFAAQRGAGVVVPAPSAPTAPNWQPVKSFKGRNTTRYSGVSQASVCMEARSEYSAQIFRQQTYSNRAVPFDYQLNCRSVTPSFRGVSDSTFMFLIVNTDFTWEVTIMCDPRPLWEKQVISLARRCEADPKAECYSAETLNYLSQVRETVFINTEFKCDFQ